MKRLKQFFKLIPLVLFILSMMYAISYSYKDEYTRGTYFLVLAILNALIICDCKAPKKENRNEKN